MLSARVEVALSKALETFGDLNSVQVERLSDDSAQWRATIRVPDFVIPGSELLFQAVGSNPAEAECLVLKRLLQTYRVRKALQNSERVSEADNLLHLFLTDIRIQLSHNARAVWDIDRALSADVCIRDLSTEELCEALRQVITNISALRLTLAEETAAMWRLYAAAAHQSLN